eukprot:CAMPEP_0197290088 /NCGR_PEP_ID=MMETSP0890-20130614/7325_1 /TAXON_ID=44058 ORGANISM="Aureoumbra lagunensis, Strain CCMP1510" /NCGR_SAMPLE_ID=MMETSP0890 /ASSEMBLY_ACC=CAM_ASM_000533 /LENGTH=422 /DNA_ID=CAMNT_0042761885 /DNA_START=35 /DNA_END=1303 /DNA_ORIENTATION=+
MADEEKLANFMAVTGASASEAQFHLEASGGNIEIAVTQYLDGGIPSSSGDSFGASGQPLPPPMATYDEEAEVRAPDRAKQQRLLESPQLLNTGAEKVGTRPGLFADNFQNMQSDDDDDDDKNDDGPPVQKGLAEIFADPVRLMHKGDFQSARKLAKEERKWLLVSITDDSFDSARLNRDVWGDETVQAVVESQFILWIRNKLDNEAIVYADRYDRDRTVIYPGSNMYRIHPKHPHLAVIDPRTGRRLWKREGATCAEKIIETLTDLVDRHNIDADPRAPELPVLTVPTSSNNSAGLPLMQQQHSLPPPPSQTNKPTPIEPELHHGPPWNTFAHPTDDGDNGDIHVQFRLIEADTNKLITRKCRFHAHETVGTLFKFAQIKSGAGPRHFELRCGYPPKPLWPLVDLTLNEAKLHGESIQMKFV